MSCVNRSSTEFKNLAQKNNVSINTLELITHEYWMETGSEEYLPSDLYIQSYLGNTQYIERGESVRELWKQRYSTPKEYTSFQEMQMAIMEAQKYFPNEAITYYKNSNGNYMLNIKEPVDKIEKIPLRKEALSNKGENYHLSYWRYVETRKKQLRNRLLNTKGLTISLARKIVSMFNEHSTIKLGLTKDMVITDSLPTEFTDVVENSSESLATKAQMNVISTFMKRLFPGIKVKTVKDRNAFEKFLSKHKLNAFAEAVLIGDTIYTHKSLDNADVLIEEFLHPFIEILYNDKQDFFKAMLEEARNSFQLLDKQINDLYSSTEYNSVPQSVRDKELVTQALSRYMRQNMGENKTTHNKFEYFVSKFLNMIKDIFGVKTLPTLRKAVNGNNIIPIDYLTNVESLYNLAEILNTKGISFNIAKGIKETPTYHLTLEPSTEQKYDTVKLDDHHIAIVSTQNEEGNISRKLEGLYDNTQTTDFPEIAFADINNTVIPEDALSDRQITSQIIRHLRQMGISVHGKSEMKAFLMEHNINNIQTLIKEGNDAIDGIEEMRTTSGELLGFTYKGDIYIDEDKISPDVPLHEYTHIWDVALAKSNPALWKKGVELMKEGSPKLWKEVEENENYGKLWKRQGIKDERLDNLIASEVHARLIGTHGNNLIQQIAKDKGADSIFTKLKEWILKAWKSLKATFSNWTDDEINNLTLKDFNHMTVRDFVEGVNPISKQLMDADAIVSQTVTTTLKSGETVAGTYTAAMGKGGSVYITFKGDPRSKILITLENVSDIINDIVGPQSNPDYNQRMNALKQGLSIDGIIISPQGDVNIVTPNRDISGNVAETILSKLLPELNTNIINKEIARLNNIIYITPNEYTDEFRRIQKASLELSPERVSSLHRSQEQFDDNARKHLGGIYEGLLTQSNDTGHGFRINLKAPDEKGGHMFSFGQVNGQLFHDIFQINRQYLPNGELVDLHDDYSNAKCFLSSDGLCGFAIEQDGTLISVFSLNPSTTKGFLYAIKDFIIEQGATHLDAYDSQLQSLESIYQKTLGFQTAATMDYNETSAKDRDTNSVQRNRRFN